MEVYNTHIRYRRYYTLMFILFGLDISILQVKCVLARCSLRYASWVSHCSATCLWKLSMVKRVPEWNTKKLGEAVIVGTSGDWKKCQIPWLFNKDSHDRLGQPVPIPTTVVVQPLSKKLTDQSACFPTFLTHWCVVTFPFSPSRSFKRTLGPWVISNTPNSKFSDVEIMLPYLLMIFSPLFSPWDSLGKVFDSFNSQIRWSLATNQRSATAAAADPIIQLLVDIASSPHISFEHHSFE